MIALHSLGAAADKLRANGIEPVELSQRIDGKRSQELRRERSESFSAVVRPV